jgi:uncharacterized protein (TIGR03437 family)
MMEDPANRRAHTPDVPDNELVLTLHVIPMEAPEITTSADGPQIFHQMSGLVVTEADKAVAGENLFLFATGLGPTHPDVDLIAPFPVAPPSVVNSPLTVTVNNVLADNVHAFGVPGTIDTYRVNFKMPAAGPGLLPVHLTAAWIKGPDAFIWA